MYNIVNVYLSKKNIYRSIFYLNTYLQYYMCTTTSYIMLNTIVILLLSHYNIFTYVDSNMTCTMLYNTQCKIHCSTDIL